ncbi:MAG: hypothetical protein JXQ75_17900 [Phycisphaerae bacterium]|nr:hypothetical protein [Phycisphaerae bacterium]
MITENDKGIALPDDVTKSLSALFAHLIKAPRQAARPFVIASDPDFPGSVCDEGWYPREEFIELRRCSHLFLDALTVVYRRDKRRDDPLRLMLFHYLHIIEADYPAALVLNALRFVTTSGSKPVWKFPPAPGSSEPTCQDPEKKFQYLAGLARAHNASLAHILSMLYKSPLRNAVAHAHFRVQHGGKLLFLTKDYSPISRKRRKSKIVGTACPAYTFEAVEKIWKCAVCYWKCADDLYRHFERQGVSD